MKFGASILAIVVVLAATLVAACGEQPASLPPRIEVVVEATVEAAPERTTTESPLPTQVATPTLSPEVAEPTDEIPLPTQVASPTPTPEPPQLASVPTPTPAPATAWLPTALPKPTTPTATRPVPDWLPRPLLTATPSTPTLPPHTPAPPTATPTSPTAAEARRIYQDAVAAINDLSSYRLRWDLIFYTSYDLRGDLISYVREMGKMSTDVYDQPPDVAKWKSVMGGGGDQTPVEAGYISIGGQTYMKPSVNMFRSDDPNRGRWIRGDEESESQDMPASSILSGIGANAVVGTERLDGVETRRLKGVVYSNSLGLETYDRMEADIWVGVADGLIRRITAYTSPDADLLVSTIMVFSDFDVPVSVEAPKDYIKLNTERLPDIPRYAPAEITPLSSGWTLAHLPDYGFSVSTPPDWVSGYYDTLGLSAAMVQYYLFPGQITAYEGDETHISVFNATIIGTLGDAALSEYVDERLEHAEAALVIDGAIDRRPETLPAGEAEVVEFAFRFPDEVFSVFGDTALGMDYDANTDYAQIQYFILSEGSAFILTFATTADRIDAMRPSFAEIAQTARIEPRS